MLGAAPDALCPDAKVSWDGWPAASPRLILSLRRSSASRGDDEDDDGKGERRPARAHAGGVAGTSSSIGMTRIAMHWSHHSQRQRGCQVGAQPARPESRGHPQPDVVGLVTGCPQGMARNGGHATLAPSKAEVGRSVASSSPRQRWRGFQQSLWNGDLNVISPKESQHPAWAQWSVAPRRPPSMAQQRRSRKHRCRRDDAGS